MVIVGLVLVSGLVFVGCPTNDDGENDPTGGKVIEEKYRGKYSYSNWYLTGTYWILSKNRIISYNNGNKSDDESPAYTEGTKLYYLVGDKWYWLGEFKDNDSYYQVDKETINYGVIYTKITD